MWFRKETAYVRKPGQTKTTSISNRFGFFLANHEKNKPFFKVKAYKPEMLITHLKYNWQ